MTLKPILQQKTKMFPGLPNPAWSVRWAILQTPFKTFDGIYADEEGPSRDRGKTGVAKDMLLINIGMYRWLKQNGQLLSQTGTGTKTEIYR